MTDPNELIAQSKSICEAATPGPWQPIDDPESVVGVPRYRAMRCPKGHGGHGGNGYVFSTTHEWHVGMRAEDSAFIATARTLVPELATALQEATDRLQTIEGTVSDCFDGGDGDAIETIRAASSLFANAYTQIAELTRERDEARAELAEHEHRAEHESQLAEDKAELLDDLLGDAHMTVMRSRNGVTT